MSDSWTEPPQWPTLGGGEAHVWLAHLPSVRGELERIAAVLSPDDCERARGFRSEEHRERAQLTRGLLRLCLARYVAQRRREESQTSPFKGRARLLTPRPMNFRESARAITFIQNAHGKPALEHPAGCGIYFNLSHSGDYAALAVTQLGEIGVDIERVRDQWPRFEEIARRHFTPGEHQSLRLRPEAERTRAFFELWSRKEAFVKARGDGVFSGLDQFEVSLAEPRVLRVEGETAANWWMGALPPLEGYAGAVAVNAVSCSPRFWQWSPRWLEANIKHQSNIKSQKAFSRDD